MIVWYVRWAIVFAELVLIIMYLDDQVKPGTPANSIDVVKIRKGEVWQFANDLLRLRLPSFLNCDDFAVTIW